MSNQLKTVTIRAYMITDLYLTVNVDADTDIEQMAEAVRWENFDVVGCMYEDETGGEFCWSDETVTENLNFDPTAEDHSAAVNEAIKECFE